MFGQGELLFGVTVLLVAFGTEHSDLLAEQFLHVWRGDDREFAREVARAAVLPGVAIPELM